MCAVTACLLCPSTMIRMMKHVGVYTSVHHIYSVNTLERFKELKYIQYTVKRESIHRVFVRSCYLSRTVVVRTSTFFMRPVIFENKNRSLRCAVH